MKNRVSIFVFAFFSVVTLQAQSVKAYQRAAEKSFAAEDYYSAMEYYRLAFEKKPGDADLAFNGAKAAWFFQAYDIAKDLLSSTLDLNPDYGEAKYYLAKIFQGEGVYEKAEAMFNDFLNSDSTNQSLRSKASKEIENCQWAIENINDKTEVKVRPLKKSVNSPYSEFAPALHGDTLYYTSFRYENKADKNLPRKRISKVLYSIRGSRGRPLPKKFNAPDKHTAYSALSPKEDRIYFTICEYLEGTLDIRCQLYFRKKDKRKRWAKAKPLSSEINLPGYTTTQPHVVYDPELKAEVLYFVSDRPGGKGGLDIWTSVLNKKGNPGKPVNLEDINTEADEMSPFIHQPSHTLFFSSNGYVGFGNFDIYKSDLGKNQKWQTPENVGYPINGSYNDLYFILHPDSTKAFLSSNREGALFLDKKLKSCCNDIFQVNIPTPIPEVTTTTDTTTMVTLPPKEDTLWVDVPLVPIPNEKPFEPTTLEDFLPLELYFDNDEPDRRTRKTTTTKTYGQSFDAYYAQKSVYLSEYTQGLVEAERWDAEDRMNAFFESEVKRNAELLDRFAEILLGRLNGGEKIEIFMKGFTSPRAKSDYNLNLGKRRISSVRNHFYQYQNGVFLPFLNTGQLKITERSFGEISADQSVSADLNDRKNSIYSIGAAKERRVEIMEIKSSR